MTVIPPTRDGAVDARAVVDAIRKDTRLVAVMLANNETGIIQPVAEVARAARDRGVHIHCDAVQGAGKIDIDVDSLSVDTLSLSAHKMHAPKGIGALYVRRGTSMQAHLLGGAQERRRRAGTENVPLAAAFGVAATLASDAKPRAEVRALRDRFEALLASLDVTINGARAERLPNTSSVMFRGGDAEGIVIALDLSGIAASTGSACSSGRVEPSKTLLAMGLTAEEAKSTVRFSLSRFTTPTEIDAVVAALTSTLSRAQRGISGGAARS